MSVQTAGEAVEADRVTRAPIVSGELRADPLLRPRKVNGQINGMGKTVEQDRCCADVLQQPAAAQSALEAISRKVARNCLERCVTDAVNRGDPLIHDEVMRVVFRDR